MTKKELYEGFVAEAQEALGNKFEKIAGIVDEYLKPKTRASVNLDDIVRRDDNGFAIEIECRKSGVWLPATSEFFPNDKSDKGIVNENGESLWTISKQAQKVDTQFKKTVAASRNAIINDIASGEVTGDNLAAIQEELKSLNDQKPDYSVVTAEPVAEEPAE